MHTGSDDVHAHHDASTPSSLPRWPLAAGLLGPCLPRALTSAITRLCARPVPASGAPLVTICRPWAVACWAQRPSSFKGSLAVTGAFCVPGSVLGALRLTVSFLLLSPTSERTGVPLLGPAWAIQRAFDEPLSSRGRSQGPAEQSTGLTY